MSLELSNYGSELIKHTPPRCKGGPMRYFNYDENEDYQEEVDHFFEEGHISFEGEDDEELQGTEYIEMTNIDFVIDPKPQILSEALKISQKSWLWKFRSHKYKMKQISETYTLLSHLLYGEEKLEEE